LRKLIEAPSGIAGVEEMVALRARMNPRVWAVARALDAVRGRDPEVERSWQDRLASRLRGCQQIVARLAREGSLRPGLGERQAADLLWSLTSLRTWEDLVLERRWTAEQYRALLGDDPRRPHRRRGGPGEPWSVCASGFTRRPPPVTQGDRRGSS